MGKVIKKKIFVLAPNFYGYTKSILEKIRYYGMEVDFFDTRPPVNGFQKAKMRKNTEYNHKILEQYKDYIIANTKDKCYALIVVIACVTFNKEQLQTILDFHGCPKIFYMWDSFCNYPQTVEILPLFHKNYSFDPIDCKNYNMIYQPTFYSENCLEAKNNNRSLAVNNDVFFIGSYLPQRYETLKKFISYAKEIKFSFRYHFYVKSFFVYLYFKLKNRGGQMKWKHFTSKEMGESEKLKNITASQCILDIPFGEQAGLTMRVIEGIVLNKKIITTNKEVKNYDFYKTGNVAVITETDFSEVSREFLNRETVEYDKDCEELYSVNNWVKKIVLENL